MTLNDSDRTKTETFLEIMQTLQKIDPEFPLHYSICLAVIAMNEGLCLTDLADKTRLSLSTVSRIVGALSNYRQNGQPFGLIELRVSPVERRRKDLYLTSKGRTAMQDITAVLDHFSMTGS